MKDNRLHPAPREKLDQMALESNLRNPDENRLTFSFGADCQPAAHVPILSLPVPRGRAPLRSPPVSASVHPVPDTFIRRHIGPSAPEIAEMLSTIGYPSLDAFIDATVPENIRLRRGLALPGAQSEQDALANFRAEMSANEVRRSFIGMGYYDTHTPAVIQRNILENPGWYTAYTPYQAEIAQGRLEALLNYQTVVSDLTGLPIANASLLDEGTAAAEAVTMIHGLVGKDGRDVFLIAADLLALTLLVPPGEFGADIVVGNSQRFGVPMGFGGPHAAFFACKDEYKRSMPGRPCRPRRSSTPSP